MHEREEGDHIIIFRSLIARHQLSLLTGSPFLPLTLFFQEEKETAKQQSLCDQLISSHPLWTRGSQGGKPASKQQQRQHNKTATRTSSTSQSRDVLRAVPACVCVITYPSCFSGGKLGNERVCLALVWPAVLITVAGKATASACVCLLLTAQFPALRENERVFTFASPLSPPVNTD